MLLLKNMFVRAASLCTAPSKSIPLIWRRAAWASKSIPPIWRRAAWADSVWRGICIRGGPRAGQGALPSIGVRHLALVLVIYDSFEDDHAIIHG